MTRVILHYNEKGKLNGIASDEPLEVFCVDERCGSDRVYRYNSGAYEDDPTGAHHFYLTGEKLVDLLLGKSEVGHFKDGKTPSTQVFQFRKPEA